MKIFVCGFLVLSLETAKIFLAEFWTPFIGATVGVSFIWLVGRFLSKPRLAFMNAKAFPELSTKSKDEQGRLLHEASALAYRHWRSFVPAIVLAISIATGAAVAQT